MVRQAHHDILLSSVVRQAHHDTMILLSRITQSTSERGNGC